jgi:3-deoxy-D-manno-octulosonic-acid transferase
VQLLLEADAACQVTGRGELVTKLAELCGDTGLRTGLGERAVALIRRNQGSTQRTLETLAPLLGSAPT